MARSYPRFLYSDPQNTKSKGPFIIHTLEPKFICRISPFRQEPDKDGFQVFSNREFLLTIVDGYIDQGDRKVIDSTFDWLENQIRNNEIKLSLK